MTIEKPFNKIVNILFTILHFGLSYPPKINYVFLFYMFLNDNSIKVRKK